MKLVNIVGARPQFIKAAVISRAIASHNEKHAGSADCIEEIIVHTGQHYDANMAAVFFDELKIPQPRFNLGVGSGTHGQMTGEMLQKIETVLLDEKPDWVMVHGDTNSTLAGALAAAKLHIPLAHVEAGLRSYNKKMPEEINRILTDHVATILFCPTRTAVSNLARESIQDGVFLTGDVMYDSFLFYAELARRKSQILAELGLTSGRYLLATVHRAENTDDAECLQRILSAFEKIASAGFPLIWPVHPRTHRRLADADLAGGPNTGVRRIAPLSYLDMMRLMTNAKVVLTDSGGVQKEAYFAGVPCITLRNETEWPETLSAGWNRLAGTAAESIIAAFRQAAPAEKQTGTNAFGDGRSGDKMVDIILKDRIQ
jgi:UDP-GlcNAc3NAcA epimerase